MSGVVSTGVERPHGARLEERRVEDEGGSRATRLRDDELTLVEATQAGLFRPLGQGDAGIDEVVDLLNLAGYERWLVLEQGAAFPGGEPPVDRGPVIDVRTRIDDLRSLAPARRERVAES